MDFQDIKSAFDLGSIIVSNGKLSILYTNSGLGYTHQGFSDNSSYKDFDKSKKVFETLLEKSESFSFNLFGDHKFCLDFEIPGITDDRSIAFLPSSFRNQEDEMDFLESIPIKNQELFKNAMDVATEFNPYDPEEFQIAIAELENLRENIEDPTRNEINLDNWIRWKSMIGFAKSFYSLMRIGLVEIGEPIGSTGGYVEFQVETSSYLRLFMSGEVKDRFLDLVRSCKVAEFEAVNNDNGPITYGNITFYS